jgi:hypothetical protein
MIIFQRFHIRIHIILGRFLLQSLQESLRRRDLPEYKALLESYGIK